MIETPSPTSSWYDLSSQQRRQVRRAGLDGLMAAVEWRFVVLPVAILALGLYNGDLLRLESVFLGLGLSCIAASLVWAFGVRRIARDAENRPGQRLLAASLPLLAATGSWSTVTARELYQAGLAGPGAFAYLVSALLMAFALHELALSIPLLDAHIGLLTLPLAAGLAARAQPAAAVAALATLGLALLICYRGRLHHQQIWERHVRDVLMPSRDLDLKQARAELKQAYNDLEQEVKDRTENVQQVMTQLEARERDYRQIFEQAHDAILILDVKDERILNVNPRGCELYGFSRQEMLGLSLRRLSKDVKFGRQKLVETLESKDVLIFRTQQFHRDGTPITLDIRASVIEYQGQSAILSINRDITEQQRIAELKTAKENAERANLAKSEFLANMSHEVRTPMGGIIGLSELLLKEDLAGRSRRFTESIQTSARSLLEVIDDVLDFSKIEAGRMTLELCVFDLRQVLVRLIDLINPSAALKGIEVSCHVSEELPIFVYGPESRLRQVLLNLLGNAVKFTDQGEVQVQVADTKGGQDGAPLAVRFAVRDTGPGMATELVPALFEPFTQGDSSTAREHEGSGLGLAICRRLVNLMGGQIEVETRLGEGSEFHFTIEMEAAEQPQPTAASQAPRAANLSRKILVAEDSEINQMVILEHLSDLGYEAHAVADGHEALTALKQSSYSLILMDCQMPGLDGYQTTGQIRADEAATSKSATSKSATSKSTTKRIPIIALTAHALKGDRERCLEAGMDDYISKPFRAADLQDALEKWLDAE